MNALGAILVGLLAGAVGGLMGVGGGILFVPALTIFFGKTQVQAEATSLLAIIPVALVGTWRQRGYGNVCLKDALVIGALSPLGVLVGTVVANNLPQQALRIAFAILILFVAGQLVRRALRDGGEREPQAGAARPGV